MPMIQVRKIALTTRVAPPVVYVAGTYPTRQLRIRTERARTQNSTRSVAVLRPLGRDDTRRTYAALHPALERFQHAVLRVRVRSHPLSKIVGDFAAATMTHARHDVELHEVVDSGAAHS